MAGTFGGLVSLSLCRDDTTSFPRPSPVAKSSGTDVRKKEDSKQATSNVNSETKETSEWPWPL